MASYDKRTYQTWRVKSEHHAGRRTFRKSDEASAYAGELTAAGIKDAKVTTYTSTSWQVRIRSSLVPGPLTKTFRTKREAIEWAQAREGEIATRKFVDYRSADKVTLADLLRKYDTEVLVNANGLPADHPDRSRVRTLCRDPIADLKMSVLQTGDIAAYRNQRMGVSAGQASEVPGESVALQPGDGSSSKQTVVKGSTVIKELELMARVIGLARAEWKLHLPLNPASGVLVKRPKLTEADERDRRLATSVDRQGMVPTRDRRINEDEEFEFDPETQELLSMTQTEQQLLLRALRYPEWFRPRKKNVTAATLRARQKAAPKPMVKARLRRGGGAWAVSSFAIETALRRREMTELRWSQVYFDHGNGYLLLSPYLTKNRRRRMVPLTLRARRILQTRPRTSEYVFNTNANTVKCAYRRAKERVQIFDLRLHDLRHEATSRLFEKTSLRDAEIGSITGHTDPRMLERYYNKRPEEFVQRFQSSFTKREGAAGRN
jgi:integrase